MYNNKILGLCLGNSITEYVNSFNLDVHDFTILLAFTLFGDPSLSIEDGKVTKRKMVLESNIWNDNFDSYNTGQFLNGTADDGGWNILHNRSSEHGAYVVDDYARSTPNSVIVNGAVDLVHEFSKIRSGNLTFRDWVYIPSGFEHGESTIVLLGYYNSDQYYSTEGVYAQVAISFDANNKIVTCDGSIEHLPVIFNDWVEIRVEIDLESDWFECYYNDELLTGQKWSTGWGDHTDGFLNFAGVDLWMSYGEEYCVYHDDMSIYYEGTGLEPDLQCDGSLSLSCKGGETVSDTFTVKNNGDLGSRLEWIVYDAPEYSSDSFWLFYPFRDALTPEDGELTVTATLTAPEEVGDYTGFIKIHAIGDPSDSCEIPVTLTVSKTKTLNLFNILERLVCHFPFFEKILNQIVSLENQ